MLERALPIPEIALGEDLRTRGRTITRKRVQGIWDRIKEPLRALVDFFANGGPLS